MPNSEGKFFMIMISDFSSNEKKRKKKENKKGKKILGEEHGLAWWCTDKGIMYLRKNRKKG